MIISLISGCFFHNFKGTKNKEMNHYPSNLTDNQWQVIEKFLDVQVRKRKHPTQKHSKRNQLPPKNGLSVEVVYT